ncbi:MAG: hypothetical protein WCT26_02190 [Candidatus Buchananbacteria bacterium]|jgi:hypothetical protein
MDSNDGRQLNDMRSDELYRKIMAEIGSEQKNAQQRKTAFYAFLLLVSLILLFPAYNLLKENIISSGFMDYVSLIFSDWAIIYKYWRSFGLSLLEVLPAMSLAAFLVVILAILESVRYLSGQLAGQHIKFKLN